ncbi:MAG TPA: TRAP transporter substrate-binding protein DctP [Paenalcaligenes sp.]|nr:TRAP transporter substrate-binding protein DctP [Paenalcaligenes sp.]
MKRLLTTIFGASLALSLGVAHAADYTMRISHQFPPSHPTAIIMDEFAKDVDEATDGQVEVKIYGSAQLFKPNQHHAAVAGGEIESAIILSIQWGGSLPEMAVTQLPFLMSSIDEQENFTQSAAAQELSDLMLAKGVKNIAWILDAPDQIFTSTNHPLDSPEKFDGVKIRGYNKLFDSGLIEMGASPVSMAGSEVYQALQTGVVDAAVTAPKAAYTRKYPEVQKYGAIIPIFPVFDNLTVNPTWWDGLPEDIQQAISQAADKAVKTSFDEFRGSGPQDVKNLEEAGMEITLVTDEATLGEFQEIMFPPIRDAFLSSVGEASGKKLIELMQ